MKSDSHASIGPKFDNYSHAYQYNNHERGLIKYFNLYIPSRRVHRSIVIYLLMKTRFLCCLIYICLYDVHIEFYVSYVVHCRCTSVECDSI